SALVYCVPRSARLRSGVIDPGTGRSHPTALSVFPRHSWRKPRPHARSALSLGPARGRIGTVDNPSVPLPSPREAPNGFQRRIGISLGLVVVAFTFLIVRLWQLQVVEGEYHRTLSENNRVRLKRVNAARGLIYDRSGQLLVENRPSFDVVMVPEDARRPQDVLSRLGGFLQQDVADARQALASASASHRPPFE